MRRTWSPPLGHREMGWTRPRLRSGLRREGARGGSGAIPAPAGSRRRRSRRPRGRGRAGSARRRPRDNPVSRRRSAASTPLQPSSSQREGIAHAGRVGRIEHERSARRSSRGSARGASITPPGDSSRTMPWRARDASCSPARVMRPRTAWCPRRPRCPGSACRRSAARGGPRPRARGSRPRQVMPEHVVERRPRDAARAPERPAHGLDHRPGERRELVSRRATRPPR